MSTSHLIHVCVYFITYFLCCNVFHLCVLIVVCYYLDWCWWKTDRRGWFTLYMARSVSPRRHLQCSFKWCFAGALTQSSLPLVRLLSLSKIALRHNFLSALLTIAGGIMSVHYRTIIQVSNSCWCKYQATCSNRYIVDAPLLYVRDQQKLEILHPLKLPCPLLVMISTYIQS